MTDDDATLSDRFARLWAETSEARDRSLRDQLAILLRNLGQTESLVVGIVVNAATIAVGLAGYWWLDGWLAFAAMVFAILGVLGLVSGVLRG